MPHRILVRFSLLAALGMTGACSLVQSYMPGDEEDGAHSMPAAETASYTPAPVAAPAPRPAAPATQTWVAEVDRNPVSVPIRPGAPERYTVVRGDTLWDISGLFLEDPWLWPEIWHVNPQINNPHLIYPGDVLRLVWVDGQPRIVMERDMMAADVRLSPQVRYGSLDDAIQTIPYDAIASFLSKPTVLDKKTVKNAPYILDIRESHLIAGSGFHVYVRGTDAGVGTRFRVYHIGDPLYDPDNGRLLGYEGLYVGEGRITDPGDPSTMFLTETRREALKGDRLIFEDPELPLNFFPRAPARPVDGTILSVVDGVSLIGTYQIVTLNLGAEDGVVPGTVLSIYQTGEVVRDRFAQAGGLKGIFRSKNVQLPDKHAGALMVFRVTEDMSFGLVMHATSEISVLDAVRNPE